MEIYHATVFLAALMRVAGVSGQAVFAQSSGAGAQGNAPTGNQSEQGTSGEGYHPPSHWEGYLGSEAANRAPTKSYRGNASLENKH
jgi:hypothetical protein